MRPAGRSLPTPVLSGVELDLYKVNFGNKCLIDFARSKVVKILKRAKLPNLSKAEKRAIEEFKQYDDIADKCNNTVVMNKQEYDKKTFRIVF